MLYKAIVAEKAIIVSLIPSQGNKLFNFIVLTQTNCEVEKSPPFIRNAKSQKIKYGMS